VVRVHPARDVADRGRAGGEQPRQHGTAPAVQATSNPAAEAPGSQTPASIAASATAAGATTSAPDVRTNLIRTVIREFSAR
jgi:hypothetical protein